MERIPSQLIHLIPGPEQLELLEFLLDPDLVPYQDLDHALYLSLFPLLMVNQVILE